MIIDRRRPGIDVPGAVTGSAASGNRRSRRGGWFGGERESMFPARGLVRVCPRLGERTWVVGPVADTMGRRLARLPHPSRIADREILHAAVGERMREAPSHPRKRQGAKREAQVAKGDVAVPRNHEEVRDDAEEPRGDDIAEYPGPQRDADRGDDFDDAGREHELVAVAAEQTVDRWRQV